jgi:DNA (cytosine-5)-methyltransferase 1
MGRNERNGTVVKCISLFSGAGGLDVGAVGAGANIVACVENDPDAAQTLRLNSIGGHKSAVIEEDVKNVDFTQWRDGSDTILIGGPPCQPFSKNGYWVKNNNRLIEDDPRNMLGQYLRAVSELEPTGFLFENVESIRHPSNLPTFQRFVAEAESMGYACTVYRANSADYGVPQKRKRVFVFGIRGAKNRIDDPLQTHGDPAKPELFYDFEPEVGVGSLIKKFAAKKFSEPQEDASSGTYYNELLHVPAGKNYIALSKLDNYDGKTFRSGGRFWNFLMKLHPDLPSITIAAQPGPWVGPFHWDSRRLRVPEIAAIQTFPVGYKFFGNRRSIQKQIGNAVPCLLGQQMVNHLMKNL